MRSWQRAGREQTYLLFINTLSMTSDMSRALFAIISASFAAESIVCGSALPKRLINAANFFDVLFENLNFSFFQFSKADAVNEFLFFVEMKIEIIGEEDIIESVFIFVELCFVFSATGEVEIADVFGFGVGRGNVIFFSQEDQIRRTANLPYGFVRDEVLRHHCR